MNTTTNRDGQMSRRAFLGAGAVVASTAIAGCTARGLTGDETTDRREWTFAPAAVSEVRVTSDAGDVTAVGRGTDAIDVTAVKRSWNGQRGLDTLDVRAVLSEGVLTVVATVADRRLDSQRSPRTDVTIEVPAGEAGPEITTVDAAFGEVSLTDTRGDTRIGAVAGTILATRVDGYLSMRSTVGRIEAADVTGLDSVHTELGDVKVELLGARQDVDIRSEMGEVVVGVAHDLDLDVVAQGDGAVSSDLDLVGEQSRPWRVAGRLNDGGYRLHAVSEFGRVALRRIDG